MNFLNTYQRIVCRELVKKKFSAVDDYVISEFIMRGTHKGQFIGITPTNKVLEITGVDIDKVIDGKIIEHGGAVNTFETFLEHHLIKPV